MPISITAVSGESLARSGVSDALALQSRVPSLSLTNQGTSRNELGFAIRGQRTQESQLLTDPPVGTYFAEVVQARSVGLPMRSMTCNRPRCSRGCKARCSASKI